MLLLGQTHPLYGGEVDLDRHHRVGRRVLGTDHVLGRPSPDVREGHDRVTFACHRYRSGRDGARPGGATRLGTQPAARRPGPARSSGQKLLFRPNVSGPSVSRAPGAVGTLAVDRRQHVVTCDPAASTRASYLGRVETVLGDEPAYDGREELAGAALSRPAGGTLVSWT